MKKRYVVEILIWIFILVFTLSICIGLFHVFSKKNTYLVYFTDVDGIIVGSPIKVMGIVVGHVEKLKYEDGKIAVEFLVVKKGVKIPNGSVCQVEFTGLAGSKSIEIIPPNEKEKVVGTIIAKNPIRVKDIFEFSRGYASVLNSIELAISAVKKDDVESILAYTKVPHDGHFESFNKNLDKFNSNMENVNSVVRHVGSIEEQITMGALEVKKFVKRFRK